MRRIYESGALRRDDEPFTPTEQVDGTQPQSMRSVTGSTCSRLLVPEWLRHRAISIDVSTPRSEFDRGTAVPFRVTMKNALPFPIVISTTSPLPWTWTVDGFPEGSHVPLHDPPDESGAFVFDRGERKRFTKRWFQTFRVSDAEWESAEPGAYTIGAALNVEEPRQKGLYADTTVRITSE